ncbi:hypothetical protein FQN54_006989 [Arachnomyces sp. PD_36]|nr:hypothetical protein FQN54_006989 [Arachnomyces sp. PD_36]
MDLQPPSTLAQLPQPFKAATGSTQIGEVYSLVGSKKRKRHEVAAAIDGEGVNIYNVQSPKLIASYAVPPQSSFSCPPCSIRRKISKGTAVKRQTYCAVERPEKQVQCFSDESATASAASSTISTSSLELKGVDSSVIFLGVISAAAEGRNEDDAFDLLAIHKDGHTRRLAPDLSAEKWCFLPNAISSPQFEVHAAFLVDFEDAQKSLLRRRQDIIAGILGDGLGAASTDASILLLISHPTKSTSICPSDAQVHLFSVPVVDRVDTFSSQQTQRMKHLMTMKLPQLEGQADLSFSTPKWDFHSGSAGLSLSFDRGFINYDLSQYAPSISSHLVVGNENFRSLIRISPRSVIGAGKSSIAIYDTQYQAIQANIVVKPGDLVDVSKSARAKASITFVTYFSKLNTVVALCGNTLFGLEVKPSDTLRPTSLKRPRDGLLINAIGRGAGSSGGQTDIVKSRKQLDGLAKSGDSIAFDNLMKSELAQGVSAESHGLPSRHEFVDPEKTFYLLSKIFSFHDSSKAARHSDTSSSSQLVITMLPRDSFTWLLDSGKLTIDNIEIALRRTTRPQILPSLSRGALMQAVRDFDPSLSLLLLVLERSTELSAEDLTHALRIFLEVAHSTALNSDTSANALTNTPHNANHALEVQPNSSNVSNQEATETLLTASFSPLNLTLAKLHTQPLHKVTQSLRSILSTSETISIIHHLRHALAMGGYTSRFTENLPYGETNSAKPPTLALDTIIHLLTACIDAVGPIGWISATPAASTSTALNPDANVIADMKSEISAALAGVEEASYLKGILREFIRCAGTGSEPTSKQTEQAATNQQTRRRGVVKHEKLNGADLLTFPTGTGMDIDDGGSENDIPSAVDDGRLLPLSLKMSHSQENSGNAASANDEGSIISKTKVQKSTGEVVNRSSREIGYLKRKAVGKYSFERIIV